MIWKRIKNLWRLSGMDFEYESFNIAVSDKVYKNFSNKKEIMKFPKKQRLATIVEDKPNLFANDNSGK